MKKHLAAATIAALSPLAAAAQDFNWSDMHATVGARLWRVEWTSWFGAVGSPPIYLTADLETAVIPVASIRWKDFLLSGSYMLAKDFQFPISNYPLTERKEYDVNLGYFVLPGLALSLGYKNVKYDTNDGTYRWDMKGATVGASGSAPMSPFLSLYGTFAYGRPKLKDNAVFNDVRAKYLLTELGLAWPLGHWSPSMNGMVITTGYRYQRIGAHSNVTGITGTELNETAQGYLLGFSYSM